MNSQRILTGAVLAGGKSSRLGRDKCSLIFDGEDLLSRNVRLLRGLTGQVAVIGRNHPGVISIADDVPGTGPVGAVATALRHIKGPCLVLACDLPFMREETLALLVRAWEQKKPDTLVTAFQNSGTGKKENLVAVYEPGALTCLESNLAKGRLKLALIVPEDRTALVPIPPEADKDFFNLNTPEALLEAERRMQSPAGLNYSDRPGRMLFE